ncbi:hypothetical protein [Mucilaginibacter koreensis]
MMVSDSMAFVCCTETQMPQQEQLLLYNGHAVPPHHNEFYIFKPLTRLRHCCACCVVLRVLRAASRCCAVLHMLHPLHAALQVVNEKSLLKSAGF